MCFCKQRTEGCGRVRLWEGFQTLPVFNYSGSDRLGGPNATSAAVVFDQVQVPRKISRPVGKKAFFFSSYKSRCDKKARVVPS